MGRYIAGQYFSLVPRPCCSCVPNDGLKMRLVTYSLVPRPRPAFHHLQYIKAGRAWYLFSREHDVIEKWRKFSEKNGLHFVYYSTDYMLNAQCVRQLPSAS